LLSPLTLCIGMNRTYQVWYWCFGSDSIDFVREIHFGNFVFCVM